jgi:tRNA(Ile)-lysidine synthase
MIDRVRQYIINYKLIPSGGKQKIFAAVSGGVDSCVLLHILNELKMEFGYRLEILHFNHRTRGAENDQDQQFVEQLAKKYRLDIKIGIIKSKQIRISETYLREERLKFYSREIRRNPGAKIATGHNMDDNIETFIMRLARGSRIKGLLAIQPSRGAFIRPLLEITRKEILQFAGNNNLEYREDVSNQDTTILRNRIRHLVIPYLTKSLETDIRQNIPRVITDLRRFYEFYEEKLEQAIRHTTKKTKIGISLHRKRYLIYNETIRRGLIEYCISSVYPLNYTVSDRNLKIWDEFIAHTQAGKKLSFLDSGVATAERSHILFGDLPENMTSVFRLKLGERLKVSDRYLIRFSIVTSDKILFTNDRSVEYIDGEKSGSNLVVRFWKKGDSFRPLGMRNSRKLSDFFTDLKLSNVVKKNIPLVCHGDQIIWIAGQRLDDQFKISDKTKIIYRLELIDLNKND